MVRKLPLVALSVTLAVSCATTNPFSYENPYIASAPMKTGDYVFTTTEDVASMLDLSLPSTVEISRVSGCIDYTTGRFYGAVEGSFTKAAVDAALRFNSEFKRISGKKTYYKSSDMELMAVANGVVLFASSGMNEVYDKTYLNREVKVPEDAVSSLMTSDAGFYVSNPKILPDIGIDLNNEAVERFEFILLTAEDGSYDICFGMKSEDFANSLLTLIRAAVITQIKASGSKPDIKELKKTITEEGALVYLKNREYKEPLFASFIEVE